MNYRNFERTGWKVSEIGFGAWAIGGSWGTVCEELHVAEGICRLKLFDAPLIQSQVHRRW